MEDYLREHLEKLREISQQDIDETSRLAKINSLMILEHSSSVAQSNVEIRGLIKDAKAEYIRRLLS